MTHRNLPTLRIMLALIRTDAPTRPWLQLHRLSFLAPLVLLAFAACAPVAGLEEHQPYRGFPDSLSVPCSNGTATVDCDGVRETAPQDGHYATARPEYELSGSDVIDNVTGLSWYRKPSDLLDHAKAIEHCEFLPGEYRLPTRVELASLLDFRGGTPALIDPDMFPEVSGNEYWSATQYAGGNSDFWAINFCSCQEGGEMLGRYVGNKARVLCVKNDRPSFEPGPFVLTGEKNRFIRDERTGLMWMQKPLEPTTWLGALDACHKSQQGAYGDFRLPNVKEIATIVDDTKKGPMVSSVQTPFDVEFNIELWSSTPSKPDGQFFTFLTAGAGMRRSNGGLTYLFPLCVRGPD